MQVILMPYDFLAQGLPYIDGFTFCSFNFDSLYFWNHRKFGDILHLIWKVYSSFNRILIEQKCGRQHFYLLPHPCEKDHFTPKMAKV